MDLMDYRRKIIANIPHLMSASGAVATFSDGTESPLESLVVDIEPVQDLHGYDLPWVAGGGVNKLPPMVDGTYTGNGLTAVVKNGVATLSGTSTASGNALTIPLAEEYTVTDGYLHLCNSVANASFAPTLEDVNAISASGVAWACSPVNRVGAIPSDKIGQKWNRVRVWISSGVTISGTYAPMVCEDNTVRQYAPYENICPISGWNGVKVTRNGKNLLNPHVYTGIAYNPTVGNTVTLTDSTTQFTDNGNGVFTVTTSATWRYFNIIIPIDPTKEYATKIVFNSTGQAGVTRGYLDADFKILTKFNSTDSAISWEYSLTPEANAAYYYFVFTNRGTASATLTLTQPQFVEDTTVGDYKPYNGVSVSVDLGQTVYGGTLNVLTGVLTVDSQLITGDNNWGVYWNSHKAEQVDTNKRASFMLSLTNETVYAQRASAKCNMLIHDTVVLNGLGNKSAFCLHPTLGRYLYACLPLDTLGMSNATSATSDNDFKAAIQALGNDLQIVIPLATPYTIQLTPHQIRSLYGNNTIFADTGNTSLEYWAHA